MRLLGLISRCKMGGMLAVHVIKRIHQLAGPIEHIPFLQKGAGVPGFKHQGAQIFAGDIIHHQVIANAHREEIGDFGQVGMVEARQNGGLAQELLASLFEQI